MRDAVAAAAVRDTVAARSVCGGGAAGVQAPPACTNGRATEALLRDDAFPVSAQCMHARTASACLLSSVRHRL